IGKMIETINQTIKYEKGEMHMSQEKKFAGFNFSENKYEQEARERWGNKAVDQSYIAIKQENKEEKNEKMNDIYRQLANVRHTSPSSIEAQQAITSWYHFLNKHTGYHYSLEAFKGLGQMYIADERFTKNIDQFGEGLAQFMCETMEIFAERKQDE